MTTFDFRGHSIFYRVEGPPDAPAVVLTHGGLLDHRSWDTQVEALKDRHRILVWDLPGHGRSDSIPNFDTELGADVLVALMDHVGMSRAALVGLSAGGWIIQEVGVRYPERVRGLACIATTPLTRSMMPRPVEWLLKNSANLMRLFPYRLLLWGIARIFTQESMVRSYVREAAGQVDKRSFLAFWAGVTRSLRWEPDHQLPRPLLIARGQHDLIGAVRVLSDRWRRACPDAEYAIIPGAGHLANQDSPALTNNLLDDFLSHGRRD